MGTSAVDTPEPVSNSSNAGRSPRARHWKRSAGVAAAVALLVVGPARTAGASTPEPKDASSSRYSPTAAPSRFSTLSTGSYAWHVASTPAADHRKSGQDGAAGPAHGEFPVVAVDGTVQTRRWQWGRVDRVAEGWFAVTSDDGYRDEYALGAGVDPSAVTVGQQVTVVGVITTEHSDVGTSQRI